MILQSVSKDRLQYTHVKRQINKHDTDDILR